VRQTRVFGGGKSKQNFVVFKVPRQCSLVLLVEVRLVCGICSVLVFKEVGAAEMGRNLI
jgi:hypothetical protein